MIISENYNGYGRGLRNSLGYFSHVKHLMIDIDIG